MKELTRLLSLAPMLVLGAGLAHANLITNGGFENGGGSLTGWTETDQAAGSGSFFLQSGTGSPLNGFPVPAPSGCDTRLP